MNWDVGEPVCGVVPSSSPCPASRGPSGQSYGTKRQGEALRDGAEGTQAQLAPHEPRRQKGPSVGSLLQGWGQNGSRPMGGEAGRGQRATGRGPLPSLPFTPPPSTGLGSPGYGCTPLVCPGGPLGGRSEGQQLPPGPLPHARLGRVRLWPSQPAEGPAQGSPGTKSPSSSSSDSSGQDSGVEPLLSVAWLWPEGWSLALRSRRSAPGACGETEALARAHPHPPLPAGTRWGREACRGGSGGHRSPEEA